MSSSRLLALSHRSRGKRSHARQVVDRLSQQEELVDSLETSINRLPNPADSLAPAKDLLEAFALASWPLRIVAAWSECRRTSPQSARESCPFD